MGSSWQPGQSAAGSSGGPLACADQALSIWLSSIRAGRKPSVDQHIRGWDTLGLWNFLVIFFFNSLMKSVSAYNPQVCTQVFSSVNILKQ